MRYPGEAERELSLQLNQLKLELVGKRQLENELARYKEDAIQFQNEKAALELTLEEVKKRMRGMEQSANNQMKKEREENRHTTSQSQRLQYELSALQLKLDELQQEKDKQAAENEHYFKELEEDRNQIDSQLRDANQMISKVLSLKEI